MGLTEWPEKLGAVGEELLDDSEQERPSWATVEGMLVQLCETQAPFANSAARAYRLERYHADWRVLVVGTNGSRWVETQDIRTCWETFERLGRIGRDDVLEPGRSSAFMMALFAQIPGVERSRDDVACLVLS